MGKEKILIIDDEDEIVEFLHELLTGEGYEVFSATNGKDALKCLEKMEPSLIILDLVMPKGGGVSFYHSIARKTDGSSRYPVLILTGHSEYECVFHDLNVDGFMTKPFQFPLLLENVKKILLKHNSKAMHAAHPAGQTQPSPAASAADPAEPARTPIHFQKNIFVKDVMIKQVLKAHTSSSILGMNEKPSDKLSHVVELLRRHKIRHLPVVDGQEKLVGLVSEDNLLRHVTPKHTENGYEFNMEEIDQLILEHVMTPDPVSVHPEDPLSRASSIMSREKYGAIPVVDQENKLVGIISQIDLMRLLTRWLEAA